MFLEYEGRRYPVVLERKRVKNLNARVRENGDIYVSAAPHVPEDEILRFLEKVAPRLTQASDRNREKQPDPAFHDGAVLPWLGQELRLCWAEKPCTTVCENGVLTVFARSEEEAAHAVAQWQQSECLALCRQLNTETCQAFRAAGYQVPMARIEIRAMSSRWGSCTSARGRISINFRLMRFPLGCIRAVFCHEYAHFIHQNHSRQFYDVLRRICPDYAVWDDLLNH